MRAEYENVLDDHLGKIHFTYVNTWDELLPAHWHEHLEIIYVLGGEITPWAVDKATSYRILIFRVL